MMLTMVGTSGVPLEFSLPLLPFWMLMKTLLLLQEAKSHYIERKKIFQSLESLFFHLQSIMIRFFLYKKLHVESNKYFSPDSFSLEVKRTFDKIFEIQNSLLIHELIMFN